jgi:hypothetical protein
VGGGTTRVSSNDCNTRPLSLPSLTYSPFDTGWFSHRRPLLRRHSVYSIAKAHGRPYPRTAHTRTRAHVTSELITSNFDFFLSHLTPTANARFAGKPLPLGQGGRRHNAWLVLRNSTFGLSSTSTSPNASEYLTISRVVRAKKFDICPLPAHLHVALPHRRVPERPFSPSATSTTSAPTQAHRAYPPSPSDTSLGHETLRCAFDSLTFVPSSHAMTIQPSSTSIATCHLVGKLFWEVRTTTSPIYLTHSPSTSFVSHARSSPVPHSWVPLPRLANLVTMIVPAHLHVALPYQCIPPRTRIQPVATCYNPGLYPNPGLLGPGSLGHRGLRRRWINYRPWHLWTLGHPLPRSSNV